MLWKDISTTNIIVEFPHQLEDVPEDETVQIILPRPNA